MKAIDTNVLARFFIDDADDAQAIKQRPAAISAMAGRTFISVTVLLEFEWLMRGFYSLPRADIARVLRALSGIEQVTLEDRSSVLAALDSFDAGLDFADALHLAKSSRAGAFTTFDKQLVKRARRLGLALPIELLGA